MSQLCPFLSSWKVRSIDVLPDNKGVEVEFGIDSRPSIRFTTREFAIGRRSKKTAALARFASEAGYGKLEDVFNYLSVLPHNLVGDLFPAGPVGLESREYQPPVLSCKWPD